MVKRRIGEQNVMYPMPVTVIGTRVGDQVNFTNIAHVGILNASAPHLISLGMNKVHFSNQGIRENKTFSVNMLSAPEMIATDYVGLVSGRQVDKSSVFSVVYGELKTAPMIVDAPLSMECRLIDIYDLKEHDIFIGEIVATYAEESVLTGGKVDLAKVNPLLFDMSSVQYWTIGKAVGKCWSEGKKFGAK